MRIIQLVSARQRRGAEVFATQLSDALVSRGHDVLVVGLRPPNGDPLKPDAAGVEDVMASSNARLDVRRLRGVLRAMDRFRPDVVQANGSQTFKYSILAKRFSHHDAPVVYRNISMASQWVRGRAHRSWGRWLARSLDHVVSVSDESSRDFGATYGVPAARRSVIRRGVHIPLVRERSVARQRLAALMNASADDALLVHIGSFTREKNHAWLVETFADICAVRPDARLALIGDGELRPAVAETIAAGGLQDRICCMGVRSDAADLVAGADLLLLPSLIEGIPGVVLEAAAQQVPAVVTDVGGMREAVDDGRTGIIVSLGDRAGFAAAVLRLLADEVGRRAMGRAARMLVEERFSMAGAATRFEALYARVLGSQ